MTATATGYELLSVRVDIEPDENADVSWLEPDSGRCDELTSLERDICYREDAKRLQAFNAGDWYMTGVCTRALVRSPHGLMQTILGGALWGIESDCGGNYREEVARDCLAELADELRPLGIDATADELAAKAAWYE